MQVDVPTPGRREKDMRNSFVDEPPAERQTDDVSRDSGVMGALQTFFDPDLCWDDIAWLASITSMPIVLKGIQTGDDAVLAARHPFVAGIVVSNHGEEPIYDDPPSCGQPLAGQLQVLCWWNAPLCTALGPLISRRSLSRCHMIAHVQGEGSLTMHGAPLRFLRRFPKLLPARGSQGAWRYF